jgi:glycerol kinase
MILAIDQGTSSTKACLFEPGGEVEGRASVPVARRSSAYGAVRQDPFELAESCRQAVRDVLGEAGLRLSDLDGAALANQGESFLFLDPDGAPAGAVVGGLDPPGAAATGGLAAAPDAERIARLTGLPAHVMFAGPKLSYHRAEIGRDDLRFATLDTWLIHELDPRRPFVTDRATASRTMLVALMADDWDAGLLERFGVPAETLPQIVPCDAPEAELVVDGDSVPLLASGYDMGLALLGHGCVAPGQAKASFGTCLGVMASTGGAPLEHPGLLTSVAYQRAGLDAFALDGEIAACGALVDWAVGLGLATDAVELERLAAGAGGSGGVVVIPAIQGLGAPHWRDDVTASIVGLTAASGRVEVARAVFDAIAFSLADVLEETRLATPLADEVHVDGGLANSDWLMQRCADACGATLVRGAQTEATAYGAAALGALGAGLLDLDQVAAVGAGQAFLPDPDGAIETERRAWKEAIASALSPRAPKRLSAPMPDN